MKSVDKRLSKLISGVCFTALLSISNLAATEYHIGDAQRFSELIKTTKTLTADDIQQQYLSVESDGLSILSHRFKDADSILTAVNKHPEVYQKAVELCLPVATNIRSEAMNTMHKVAKFLKQSEVPSVNIVFGANNTGGTANAQGMALALEVICQQVSTAEEASRVMLDYIAHEIVHVYQYRMSTRTDLNFTLLELSLIEGIADLVAELATEQKSALELVRTEYGEHHEASLWAEFMPVMHQHKLYPWMYSTPADGRPSDLGYWIGKQIATAYLDNQKDKLKALKSLIILKDANEILAESRYQNSVTDEHALLD